MRPGAAAAVTLALFLAFMGSFVPFVLARKARVIQVRNLRLMFGVTVVNAASSTWSVTTLIDTPFCNCTVYLLVFVLYSEVAGEVVVRTMLHFHRLYQANFKMKSRKGIGSKAFKNESTTSQAKAGKASQSWLTRLLEANSEATRAPSYEYKVVWGVRLASLCPIGLTILYSTKEDLRLPPSFEVCSSGELRPLFTAVTFFNGAGCTFALCAIVGAIHAFTKLEFQAHDPIGLRKQLARGCISASLCISIQITLVILALANLMPMRFALGTCFVFLSYNQYTMIFRPSMQALRHLRRSRHILCRVAPEGGNMKNEKLDANLSRLLDFMLTDDGYTALHAHLREELALENLMFLVETSLLRADLHALQEREQKQEKQAKENLSGSQSWFGSRLATAGPTPVQSESSSSSGGDNNSSDQNNAGGAKRSGSGSRLIRRSPTPTEKLSQTSKSNRESRGGGGVGPSKSDLFRRLLGIYVTYVSPQSTSQINITHVASKPVEHLEQFVDTAKPDRITSLDDEEILDLGLQFTCFDIAIEEVLQLIYADSLQRFLAVPEHAVLWQNFNDAEDEVEHLA